MSTERPSFSFNSIIPQTYRSKAEAFARCLQDKLISLGNVGGFAGNVVESEEKSNYEGDDTRGNTYDCTLDNRENCAFDVVNEEDLLRDGVRLSEDELASLDDMVNYDVPYRVLRESSSTSNLEKHFANNLYVTKRISKSGIALTERLTENPEERNRDGAESEVKSNDIPAISITVMNDVENGSQMKLRRCSSLKSWKTPPGTPGEKKIVRFADALGLDLADVRTFLDEIPKIPSSAYEDLHYTDPFYKVPPPPLPTLMPKFVQPGTQIDFLDRVENDFVVLENAVLTDTAVLTVSGCVRVRNISYEKTVHIRYTNDNWTSFSDLQANYILNSCDGFSDKFSFVLYGHTLKIGENLEFAVRLDSCGVQYWDNNYGRNYVFECLPQSPSTSQLTDVPLCMTDTWYEFY